MTSTKLKKALTLVTIVCLATAGLIGIMFLVNILAEFIGDGLSSFLVKVLLTLLVVFSAGLFLLNAVEAISRKSIFGFISAGLIAISSVLFLVFIWGLWKKIDQGSAYLHATWIISAATILFNVIVGNVIGLGKKLLALQIINYVTLFYVELVIVMLICGNNTLFEESRWLLFAIVAIVWIVFTIILSIKKKAIARAAVSVAESKPVKGDTVTISRADYQALLDKIADLENQLANK